MHIHRCNAVYTNKITGHIKMGLTSKNVRENIQIDKNTPGHTIIQNYWSTSNIQYTSTYACTMPGVCTFTNTDTPHLGTHLAHPRMCMPHLHNHRICCAAELVGWKGKVWSGQEG